MTMALPFLFKYTYPWWSGHFVESDRKCPSCNAQTLNWAGTLDPEGKIGYVCEACGQHFDVMNKTGEVIFTHKVQPFKMERPKSRYDLALGKI